VADGALRSIAALAGAVLVACGGGAAGSSGGGGPAIPPMATSKVVGFPNEDGTWGRYHSKRFLLSFPLPDGRAWAIDDKSAPMLVAKHAPTSSSLRVIVTRETELMSRSLCETRARDLGWVGANLTTVDEQVQTGPDAYDSRVWVAVQPGKPGGPIEGHVFLFGGFLRQCLLVDFRTEVEAAKDEDILSSRLAVVRARVLRGLQLDPPRVTDEADVPRTKPNITR
jgi:hypothetical protein